MLKINVRYYGSARDATCTRSEVVALTHESAVREIICYLTKRYGEPLSSIMLGEDDEPTDYLTYFVGGINIYSLKGFDTELKDGDTLVIASTIVGG